MANEQTWAVVKNSQWRQLYSAEFSGANIITFHRWWHSMAIQNMDVYDDVFYVSEEVEIDVYKYVDENDPIAIIEALTQDVSMSREDIVGILEALAIEPQMVFTDAVALQEAIDIIVALGRNGEDAIAIAEAIAFEVGMGNTDPVAIAEAIAMDFSTVKVDSIPITDVVSFIVGKTATDSVSITELVEILASFGYSTTDAVAIAEAIAFEVGLGNTDSVAIAEVVAKEVGMDRSEWEIVTDSSSLQVQKPFIDVVSITEAIESYVNYSRSATDVVSVPETTSFDVSWNFDEQFSLAEARAFEVSWVKQDNVGITESTTLVFQMFEDHSDTVGITDAVHIVVWDTSESGGMSLIDDVRVAVQSVLGLTDEEVALLSINDLLHRYWSADFEDGVHTYDGSESTFTPAESYSTMDHHSSVESQYGEDLNWIRSVTAE